MLKLDAMFRELVCCLTVDFFPNPVFPSVGHGAVVHGCTIGDACIVGINAVVLNGAKIGRWVCRS